MIHAVIRAIIRTRPIPCRVEYDLAYDGGGGRWEQTYRTKTTARIAIWLNRNIFSWGGTAQLTEERDATQQR